MTRRRVTSVLLVLVALLGCERRGEPPEPATPRGSGAPEVGARPAHGPQEAATAGEPEDVSARRDAPPPVGADHPAVQPALATLARELRTCAFDRRVDGRACPAFATLGSAAAGAGEAGFTSLLQLLADPSPAVRYTAATHLRLRTFPEKGAFTRAPHLERCLAALGREPLPAVAEALGALVGRFALAETAGTAEALQVLRRHPHATARKGVLLTLLRWNRDVPGVVEAVREAARVDPEVAVRRAAIAALGDAVEGPHRAEVLAVWQEALDWPEDPLASHAARLLGQTGGGVPEAFPAVLAATRRRAEAGTTSWRFLGGLHEYLTNGGEHVDRAAVYAVCHDVLKNTAHRANARLRAIELMKASGEPGLREALAPFRRDDAAPVAERARALLEQKE